MNRGILKQGSLDESFDTFVCRPLGRSLARVLLDTRITANQVSAAAGVVGMAAGVGFAFPWPGPGYGALLLFAMMVLDCADGELARLRGGGGWRGRVLDGIADLTTSFSLHLGMLLFLDRQRTALYGFELSPTILFFIVAAAGASMAWRSGVVDDVKQRLKDDSIDNDLHRHVGEVKTTWDRFLWWTLATYLNSIHRYPGKRRPGGYLCFRRAQLVGPTHNLLAIAAAGLLVQYSPMAYLTYFFISLVPANLYMLMVLRLAPSRGISGVDSPPLWPTPISKA